MFRHSQVISSAMVVAMTTLMLSTAAAADNRVFDNRFHHDRYYPARGVAVRELPQAAQSIRFHETPYYFHGGTWYRPSRGVGFRVIAPPIGVLVPFLPSYYTTVWLGGMPYYYANDVYYQWLPDQREYIVATPPPEAGLSTEPPGAPTDEPFIYPRNGQSAQQQATDRYECHAWAAQQTQYDPTQPAGSLASDQVADKRGGYFRAMTACLESRGYSAK
jgi:hypothetical protein